MVAALCGWVWKFEFLACGWVFGDCLGGFGLLVISFEIGSQGGVI